MAKVHATAVVDAAARLGEGVEIGPYCIVGPRVTLGARTRLLSHVNIEGLTEIGEDCVIHPFASLGGPPQHTAYKGEDTRLVIGAHNLIREHVTMNTGSSVGGGVTRVGADCTFQIGAHVAHDCSVGDGVLMTNMATLGGHVTLDDYAIVGGMAAVHQNCRVGRYAFIGGGAMAVSDVIPYGMAWGNHAHLAGLNLVGLKRRRFSREQINTLRAAFRAIFFGDGLFDERVSHAADAYGASAQVMEIVAFIRTDANRPLCLPAHKA
ncbi:MAG TPA: acyl-ACP--UDP-N-acetylglucosamine O-acyltransferase [Caulobacteraceae bacterium]|nr:acyl-ACP--UDP-N-acetylglucosamine O-acyltransferase [Caulobacteraceae bacterium]